MRPGVSGTVVTTLGMSALLVGCVTSGTATAPTTRSSVSVEPVAIGAAAIGAAASPSSAPAEPGADAVLSIGTGAVDTMGGSIPDGQMVSPFDVGNPVVGFLDPLLITAIQDATRAAAGEGVGVMLASGWRSRGFQRRLFDEALTTYGSADVARQFVASPEASMHVVGEAVDVGPVAADDWMIRNGPRFGLCQIYANEIWHFELAVDAAGNCPALRPNAAG